MKPGIANLNVYQGHSFSKEFTFKSLFPDGNFAFEAYSPELAQSFPLSHERSVNSLGHTAVTLNINTNFFDDLVFQKNEAFKVWRWEMTFTEALGESTLLMRGSIIIHRTLASASTSSRPDPGAITQEVDPTVEDWAKKEAEDVVTLIPSEKLNNIRYGRGSLLPHDDTVFSVFYLETTSKLFFWNGTDWQDTMAEISDPDDFVSRFDSGPELPPVSLDIPDLKAFLVRNNGVNALYAFNNPPNEDLYNSLITAIAEKEITGLRGLASASSSSGRNGAVKLGLTAAGGLLVAGDGHNDSNYATAYDDFTNPVAYAAGSLRHYPLVSFVANNIVFMVYYDGSFHLNDYRVGTTVENFGAEKTIVVPDTFNLTSFIKSSSVFSNNRLLRLYQQGTHSATILLYTFDETEREFAFDQRIDNIAFETNFAFSDGINIFVSDKNSSSEASFKGYHLSSGLRNSDVDFSVNVGNRTASRGIIIQGQLFLACYDNNDDTFYSVAAFQLGKKLGWELVNDNFLSTEKASSSQITVIPKKPKNADGNDGDLVYSAAGQVAYAKVDGSWQIVSSLETRVFYKVNALDEAPSVFPKGKDKPNTIKQNGWVVDIPDYVEGSFLYSINVLVDAMGVLKVVSPNPHKSFAWDKPEGSTKMTDLTDVDISQSEQDTAANLGKPVVLAAGRAFEVGEFPDVETVEGDVIVRRTSLYSDNQTAIRNRNLTLSADFDSFYGINIYIRDFDQDGSGRGDVQEPKFFRSSDLRVSTAAFNYSFECVYVRGGSDTSIHFRLTSKRNIQITAIGTYPTTVDEHPTIYEIEGVDFAPFDDARIVTLETKIADLETRVTALET